MALMASSQNGHLEVVKELLKYGADPNAKDYEGKTALDYTLKGNIKRSWTTLDSS